jgi:hypothetical protein
LDKALTCVIILKFVEFGINGKYINWIVFGLLLIMQDFVFESVQVGLESMHNSL